MDVDEARPAENDYLQLAVSKRCSAQADNQPRGRQQPFQENTLIQAIEVAVKHIGGQSQSVA